MSTLTRALLIAACGLIATLESGRCLRLVREGWQGAYSVRAEIESAARASSARAVAVVDAQHTARLASGWVATTLTR